LPNSLFAFSFAVTTLLASGATPAVAPVAQLGVELPTLGGANWFTVVSKQYVTPAILADIRDNLHATYVRTGWIPGRLHFEKIRWRREDLGMDTICGSGLHVMMILPSPVAGGADRSALVDNVREFFSRYTARDPGCIAWAEVGNEADLPENGFASVMDYAGYYRDVAPIVAAFHIPVITTGVSGENLAWTSELANLLYATKSPVSGYGFHPYGVKPADMAGATVAVRQAAGELAKGSFPSVYVTEIGKADAHDLYATIVNLARATPAITIYEYQAQPNEDPRYGLKNNPALYSAVQRAWEALHGQRTGSNG
jgi:hypothetical protein